MHQTNTIAASMASLAAQAAPARIFNGPMPEEVQAQIEHERAAFRAAGARMESNHGRATAIQARCDRERRDRTPAEETQMDRVMAAFDEAHEEARAIQARIEALEATPQPRQAAPNPVSTSFTSQAARPASVGSPLFSNMFPGAVPRASQRGEFGDMGEFARAVFERNPRLFSNAATGMGEGVGVDGGFYVPPHLFAATMDNSLQAEAIRPGATIIPMTSSAVSIPMFDLSNRSTGIATLEGKATAEGVTGTTQKAKTRMVEMAARKISILVPASTELLQDAPQLFGGLLQAAMQEALGQTLDTWFISGTGAGNPLGIMNAPCLVSVAKDTSQVAATLTPTNIAGMVSRLAPGAWARSQWIVSPSALAQLFVLATVTKNVAGTENVSGHAPEFFSVLPDGKFALCGRPLIVSDRCQALGTKGDIMLVDLKSYLVGIRQNAELAVDTSIGFKESEVWFRLNCRVEWSAGPCRCDHPAGWKRHAESVRHARHAGLTLQIGCARLTARAPGRTRPLALVLGLHKRHTRPASL